MGTETAKPQGTVHFLVLGTSALLSIIGPKVQEEGGIIKTIKEAAVWRDILKGAVTSGKGHSPPETWREGALLSFPHWPAGARGAGLH